MFSIQTKNFFKLYRHYLKKIRSSLLILLFTLLFVFTNIFSFKDTLSPKVLASTTLIYQTFLILSLFSTFSPLGLMLFLSLAVSRLNGISGFFKRSQDRSEEAHLIQFACPNTRQTMVAAKLAAVTTYYFGVNLFGITLPFLLGLVFSTSLSVSALFSFFLLHGLLLSLVNFLWVVPALFYFTAELSLKWTLLSMLYLLVVAVPGIIIYIWLPLLSPFFFLASIPVGVFFWLRYWKTFRDRDLAV